MTDKKYRFSVQGLFISFVIIAICESFFLLDIYADFFHVDINTWVDHNSIELLSTITLAFTLIIIGIQIRWLLKEHRQDKNTIEIASGELLLVIRRHFVKWKLSPSEQEIALFLIKGMSTQEIADIRKTKMGTVKSQTNSIYQKAGVNGRNELVAYFVEDLLAGENILHTSQMS